MKLDDLSILVVDDLQSMRNFMKKMCENIGFGRVEIAFDGANALTILTTAADKDEPFDFILSDWNMPNMTGLELLQMVRSTESIQDIPILMATTERSKAKIVEAVRSGVDGYIGKPFTQDVLAKKITSILKERAENAK